MCTMKKDLHVIDENTERNLNLSGLNHASTDKLEVECHPWEPFIPKHAKVLIMGTFPPGRHRWSMNFYYPNRTNDFWKICGLLFCGDKNALYLPDGKNFDQEAIRNLVGRLGIAMNDTARKVRRLRGNASDKFLEIVQPVPLKELLSQMPECHAVATTGQKAAEVIASLTGTEVPKMGEYVTSPDGLEIWRMPSTSRAYPMAVEKKAEFYARMFRHLGVMEN